MPTDEELIEGCAKEDRHMQYQLYQKYSGQMYAICLRYCKMQQEAEDVLQEGFVKVFNHIKTFRKESSLFYWIKRIVINTALNHQRNKLYMYPMVDVADLRQPSANHDLLAGLQLEDLMVMIQDLPSGCQTIFNLYAIEGYKHHEIAELLGVTEGTSKSQYARAKQLLQEKLEKLESTNYGSRR
ncbi:MAG: RNA polymerase sigma factor [Imperialibacter sp.]